ncbi:alpha/beta family hydrolase [Pseudomonadota bacterium]
MRIESRNINVEGNTFVSSEWLIPEDFEGGAALLIAHGAGNDMHSPFIRYIHSSVAERGLLAVRFNFPYKERGGKVPDPASRLIKTWRAVVCAVAEDEELSTSGIFLSGKSLGGRMASMFVADGGSADGLIFFGYPLHPAGKPEKLRSVHFSTIDRPALFLQGTRDPLCDLALLRREIIDKSPGNRALHIIDGADHSFRVLKKFNRSEQSVYGEIVDTTVNWICGALPS